MCVGCRQRGEAITLIRFVAREADGGLRVVADTRRTMPGRGAWLHPREECLALAVRRRSFGPALRVKELMTDPEDLAEAVGGISDQGQVAEDMSTP